MLKKAEEIKKWFEKKARADDFKKSLIYIRKKTVLLFYVHFTNLDYLNKYRKSAIKKYHPT